MHAHVGSGARKEGEEFVKAFEPLKFIGKTRGNRAGILRLTSDVTGSTKRVLPFQRLGNTYSPALSINRISAS